jgi:serine/threonine protein kinase
MLTSPPSLCLSVCVCVSAAAKCIPPAPEEEDLEAALFEKEGVAKTDDEHRLASFGFNSYSTSCLNLNRNFSSGDNASDDAPSRLMTRSADDHDHDHSAVSSLDADACRPHQQFGPAVTRRLYSVIGTARYMAPEMVVLMEGLGFAGDSGYTEAVDWWALGVMIYKLLNGALPFLEHAPYSMPRWVDLMGDVDYESLDSGPDGAATVDLVQQLLRVDDSKRLGFGENGAVNVATHSYFRAIDWTLLEQKRVMPPALPTLPRSSARSGTSTPKTPRGGFDSIEQMVVANNRSDWLSFGTAKISEARTAREKEVQQKLRCWDYTSPEAIVAETMILEANCH